MELTPRKFTANEMQAITKTAAQILPAFLPREHAPEHHTKAAREDRVNLAFLYAEEILRRVGWIK